MLKQSSNGEISLFHVVSATIIGFIIIVSVFNFIQDKTEERKIERISQETIQIG